MNNYWADFSSLARFGVLPQPFAAGSRIFVADEQGDCMYLVRSGRVSITAHGTVVESVGPGGLFGEMSLIDGSPRSATATAAENCELIPVDRATFLQFVRQSPDFALHVMQLLVSRLRQMNESL